MIKYCRNCLFPDTKPDLTLDENGVCSACRFAVQKEEIDWNERRQELKNILEKFRNRTGSNWDCIIPVSGGKDSTYATIVIKKEFGLNPLLVRFSPREFTDLGRKNIDPFRWDYRFC